MTYALHQHNKDVGTANNMESDNYYKGQDNTETCYTHIMIVFMYTLRLEMSYGVAWQVIRIFLCHFLSQNCILA